MACRHHDDSHVCLECPGVAFTDGAGFPHPTGVAKGRTALRRCPGCQRLVTRAEWRGDAWRCVSCVTPEAA